MYNLNIMYTMDATEARNNFSALLDTAQREPVVINKQGRGRVVVLSLEDYAQFERFMDAHWAKRAIRASKKGYIGEKQTLAVLTAYADADA